MGKTETEREHEHGMGTSRKNMVRIQKKEKGQTLGKWQWVRMPDYKLNRVSNISEHKMAFLYQIFLHYEHQTSNTLILKGNLNIKIQVKPD